MSLVSFPDWLACVSEWLRDQPELDAVLDGRCYTELPRDKTFPLLVVNQISDPSVTEDVHWAVDALFQVDVWGGPKAVTWTVAETARALLSQRFAQAAHDLDNGAIVVSRVRSGGIRRTTDTVATQATESDAEVSRARPRASFDFAAILKPGRPAGS